MRLLVCGSRDWYDARMIREQMIRLARDAREHGWSVTVVEGDARGADKIAGEVAESLGFGVERHPADWTGRGRVAGFERNNLMLSLGVDLLWAFKDGCDHSLRRGGTEHMVKIATAANVPWRLFSHD